MSDSPEFLAGKGDTIDAPASDPVWRKRAGEYWKQMARDHSLITNLKEENAALKRLLSIREKTATD